MSQASSAIQAQDLAKRFDEVQAVNQVSITVDAGELFGFLGPNGAGKTTTINMLTGLARPDAGCITIGGIDCSSNPKAAQHLIGVVADESNLYPELSGFDNLCFCGSLYGMRRAEREERARELLESFGLAKAADRRFGGYSRGMKRRLTIAAGILHRPQILFLDEPTTGIDLASARQVRKLILELHKAGTTIFLTTHYIEEAERLCDRIAFLVEGRVIHQDSVSNLLQPFRGRQRLLITCTYHEHPLLEPLRAAFPALEFSSADKNSYQVEADHSIKVGPLLRFLEESGAEVLEARRIGNSLEEVFLQITGLAAEAMRKEKGAGDK